MPHSEPTQRVGRGRDIAHSSLVTIATATLRRHAKHHRGKLQTSRPMCDRSHRTTDGESQLHQLSTTLQRLLDDATDDDLVRAPPWAARRLGHGHVDGNEPQRARSDRSGQRGPLVAAGASVTNDVAPYMIVAGILAVPLARAVQPKLSADRMMAWRGGTWPTTRCHRCAWGLPIASAEASGRFTNNADASGKICQCSGSLCPAKTTSARIPAARH